jgi:hypothetical protein
MSANSLPLVTVLAPQNYLYRPNAITFAGNGNLYVATQAGFPTGLSTTYETGKLVKVDTSTGNQTLISQGDFGPVTSATYNTLTDGTANKSWSNNIWAGKTVRIIAGRDVGDAVTVISNNANTLSISQNWSFTPDSTSSYEINFSTATDMTPVPNDSNDVFVADQPGGATGGIGTNPGGPGGIWKVNLTTGSQTQIVQGGGLNGTKPYFAHPGFMALDPNGNIIVGGARNTTDYIDGSLVQINPNNISNPTILSQSAWLGGADGIAVDSNTPTANIYIGELAGGSQHTNSQMVSFYDDTQHGINQVKNTDVSDSGYLATVEGMIIYSSSGGHSTPLRGTTVPMPLTIKPPRASAGLPTNDTSAAVTTREPGPQIMLHSDGLTLPAAGNVAGWTAENVTRAMAALDFLFADFGVIIREEMVPGVTIF